MVIWSKATLITTPGRGTKAHPRAIYAMEEQTPLFMWTLLTSSEFSSLVDCVQAHDQLSCWQGSEKKTWAQSCMDHAGQCFNQREYSEQFWNREECAFISIFLPVSWEKQSYLKNQWANLYELPGMSVVCPQTAYIYHTSSTLQQYF